MPIAPEEVRNVWTGDAVRLQTPLGNFRCPPLWRWAGGVALAGGGGVLERWAAAHGSELEWFGRLGMLCGGLVIVCLFVAESLGRLNAWTAGRLLRRLPIRNHADLARACWLRAQQRRFRRSPLDVAEWLERSGTDGPRLIAVDLALPTMLAPPDVLEEAGIDSLERARGRQLWWFLLGLGVLIAIPAVGVFGTVQSSSAAVLAMTPLLVLYAVLALRQARRLGLNLLPLESSIIAPGRMSVRGLWRNVAFTREDSVMMVEPTQTIAVVLWFVRSDGRTLRLRAETGLVGELAQGVVSRWCWRRGIEKLSSDGSWSGWMADQRPVPGASDPADAAR